MSSSSTRSAARSRWARVMLPWTPMSPPVRDRSRRTYSTSGWSTYTEFAQASGGSLDVNTCFVVPLMKSANGCTSDVSQSPDQ